MIPVTTALAFAEGGGGSTLLSPDGSILVILLIFIALVPTLNALVVRPIMRVLAERERLTSGTETFAHTIVNTIEYRLASYEEAIRDARTESYKLLEARRADAAAERQTVIDRARAEAEERIAGARAEIGRDAETARGRLEADAREIARDISSNLLGRAVGGGAR